MNTVQGKAVGPELLHWFGAPYLTIDCGMITELPTRVECPQIRENMVVYAHRIDDVRSMTGDMSVDPYDGYMIIRGSISAPVRVILGMVYD